MRKALLSLGILFATAGAAMAQDKALHSSHDGHNHGTDVAQPAAAAKPATTLTSTNLAFKSEIHDFGTVAEGPNVDHEFSFTNTGKEPIIINQVQASCGCTTPSWSKEPVLPGQKGTVKASYGTQGRPGSFSKTITVTSNAGVKVLTIKGNVEKAPESSVPGNNSVIKMN